MNAETEGGIDWRGLDGEVRRHFLNDLRQARLAAQKDAEAFDEVLFVFERIGSYRLGEIVALGSYEAPLIDLANESALGHELSAQQLPWHSEAAPLLHLVRNGRNEALHQGARARHLTERTIELSLLFEDALMNGTQPMTTIGDIMVRSPVTAEVWQPISLVRQIMLVNSYSHLPIRWDDGWKLVSDVQLAAFLRKGAPSNGERKKRLALSLCEAHADGLIFEDATTVQHDVSISEVGEHPLHRPTLVVDASGNLVGIMTAFDIL